MRNVFSLPLLFIIVVGEINDGLGLKCSGCVVVVMCKLGMEDAGEMGWVLEYDLLLLLLHCVHTNSPSRLTCRKPLHRARSRVVNWRTAV
jgi:hypothetical protein